MTTTITVMTMTTGRLYFSLFSHPQRPLFSSQRENGNYFSTQNQIVGPVDLVLLRHGHSEGNYASDQTKQQDQAVWTKEFRSRHTSNYRLTRTGRSQSKIAGEWLAKTFYRKWSSDDIQPTNVGFSRMIVSEYTRALETAAHLHLPDAKWNLDILLRERDKGGLTTFPSPFFSHYHHFQIFSLLNLLILLLVVIVKLNYFFSPFWLHG